MTSSDPFEFIQLSGSDISQSTYIELIHVRRVESKTKSPKNVDNSLKELAYPSAASSNKYTPFDKSIANNPIEQQLYDNVCSINELPIYAEPDDSYNRIDRRNWELNGDSTQSSNGNIQLWTGSIIQTIYGLTPNNKIKFVIDFKGDNLTIIVKDGTTTLIDKIINQLTNTFDLITLDSGSISIELFTSNTDGIILTSLSATEHDICGFGSINHIIDSELNYGSSNWLNTSNVPSGAWDSVTKSLIVSGNQLHHDFTLPVNTRNIKLLIKIGENLPDSNDNLKFYIDIVNIDNVIIYSETLVNSDIDYPSNIIRNIDIGSGFYKLRLKSDGVAKVTDIYICEPGNHCNPNLIKVSYDTFDTNNCGWIGSVGQLPYSIYLDSKISKNYFDIPTNTNLYLSVYCRDIGGIKVSFVYDNKIETFTSDGAIGIKSFKSLSPIDATKVSIIIYKIETNLYINNIFLCYGPIDVSEKSFTNLRAVIKWNGIPRSPTNIFSSFVKITYRDKLNYKIRRVAYIIPQDMKFNNGITCDRWKQNGNGGILQKNFIDRKLSIIGLPKIKSKSIVNLDQYGNWCWSSPSSPTSDIQDEIIINYPNPVNGLIESIDVYILINNINITNQPPRFNQSQMLPDPANSFEVSIRYKSRDGYEKEFSQNVVRASLYQFSSLYTSGWDDVSNIGNGIKGISARWESMSFVIDSVDGTGSDQYTKKIGFTAIGSASCIVKSPVSSSYGKAISICRSDVLIYETIKGSRINEVQRIDLPSNSGGSWKFSFSYLEPTSIVDHGVNIPWNSSLIDIRSLIATLPNITSINNIKVTSDSSFSYTIEFIGKLAGRNLPMIEVDANNLLNTGTVLVTKLVDGTNNERQRIFSNFPSSNPMVITFAGATTAPISAQASLNTIKSALESLSTIGIGNVLISGEANDPNQFRKGPIIVDFVGSLSDQNLPTMVSGNTNYTIETVWDGGVGTNDQQKISILANYGNFALTIQNPNPTGGEVIVGPIAWNASAASVLSAITSTATWLMGNIKVTKLPHQTSSPLLVEWIVEFIGEYKSMEIDLIVGIQIDLKDTRAFVSEVVAGSGVSEVQRIDVIDSDHGTYKLFIAIDGNSQTSGIINWNASAYDVYRAITLSPYIDDDDIEIEKVGPLSSDIVSSYLITFSPRFGDVNEFTVINKTLTCHHNDSNSAEGSPHKFSPPKILSAIKSPTTIDVDNSHRCPVIDNGEHYYSDLVLERELFSPNNIKSDGSFYTVNDLVYNIGLNPNLFNIYTRNFPTTILKELKTNDVVNNRTNILIIPKIEDTELTRKRLITRLNSSPNILPLRSS